MTMMKYAEVEVRAPALAITDERQFAINNTNDPFLSGGGHQPMGRDTLLGVVYNRYRVHSIRYRVEMTSYAATFVPYVFYVGASNDTTAWSGTLTFPFEQPFGQANMRGNTADTDKNQTYTKNIKLWDLLGRTKQEYVSDDLTAALYNAAPNEQAILKIGIMSADATQVVVWAYTLVMDMEVECFDRFTQIQS